MLQQAISVSLLSAMAAAAPVASQGIRSNASISGTVYVAPASPVLVATPYPGSPADSTAAVSIGNALRLKLIAKIGGSDWRVITRAEMNSNFQTWGYAPDQLFQPDLARQVASTMQARMFVMTTLAKGAGGTFTASVRVTGISDDAGQVFKVAQIPGQTPADFGSKIADQVAIIFKVYPDAKTCVDNLVANKAKATDGANKALKVVPNYGYAEYCLGLIEQAKDSVGPETTRHFVLASTGDSLSLRAVNQLAIIHQKKHDSVAVVNDYQRLITIAPTNRILTDEAVKIFKSYGRPDAANQVIETQLKLDPTNADWPDLKGNACAAGAAGESDPVKAKPLFACAYDAFVKVVELDPTRADTNFYPKIIFVAGTRADSMTWAKRWAEKYSSSTDPYTVELSIYMDAGQVDSALTIVNLLNKVNPTDSRPALAVDMALLKARRYDDVIKLADYFKKNGDETAKNQYAGLLVTYADSESRKTPRDDSTLVHLGKTLIAFGAPNKLYTDYGYYFNVVVLGTQFPVIAKAARDDKSCDTVKRYETFLAEFDVDVQALVGSSNTSLSGYANQLAPTIATEKTFVPSAEKAFCKPPAKP